MSTNINSTRHIQFTIQITEKHLHILRFFSSGAPFSGFQFPQPSRSHMTFHLLTSSCCRQPPELHKRHYLPHIYVKLLYTCWWWNCQLSFKILIACSVRPSPCARLCVSFPLSPAEDSRNNESWRFLITMASQPLLLPLAPLAPIAPTDSCLSRSFIKIIWGDGTGVIGSLLSLLLLGCSI